MEKLKITEGEARLEQDNEQAVYVTTDVKSNLYAMGKVFKGALMEKEEWESNAKLWVDAHNTHNKCHKLPSELMEECNDRFDKIRTLTHLLKRSFEGKPDMGTKDVIEEALDWLTKIENKE